MYLTEAEYKEKTGKCITSVQKKVEVPEIYMIAPSSSSPSDQFALVSDRLECLQELSVPLTACNGEHIYDRLRFFYGDKPAAQFERGTQIGGTYKCGGCGCKDSMMLDLSHALNKPWRSIATLQSVVTSGKYGKTPGQLKPLDGLKVCQLREELNARGIKVTDKQLKPELAEKLALTLQGAQRAPTLLTGNPTQPLTELNLQHYEILDCEPLHDVKGHLFNLLPEIPHLLEEPLKSECLLILNTTIPKQKVSGAVLRTAAIKLLLKLYKSSAKSTVTMLLDTIVRVSQLLYMPSSKRSPRNVLRLYNCSWLHHELCRELLGTLKTQTLTHFFGIYLYAIVVHAPTQFQIMPLSSVNTESEERLFSQAKRISNRATNRKTDNVLPTVLISIQARQKLDTYNLSNTDQESIVQSVSSKIPPYSGTLISKNFIEKRIPSWQAHLQRISTFLEFGQGIWWENETLHYRFFDSDTDPDSRPEGPTLMHFREANLTDVQAIAKTKWTTIVDNKTVLPAPSIRVFDHNGDYKGTRFFRHPPDQQQPMDTTTTPEQTFPEVTEEEFQRLETVVQTTLTNQTRPLITTADSPTDESSPTEEVILNVVACSQHTVDEPIGDPDSLQKTNKCETCEYQTKAAKLIAKVIGRAPILLEFDFLRAKLKAQTKRPTENQKEEYITLQVKLYKSVLSAKHEAKHLVKQYITTIH